MKSVRIPLLAALAILILGGCSSIDENIDKGQFTMAKKQINSTIAKDKLNDLERIALE